MHALREVAVCTGNDADFVLAKSLMDAAGVDASKYQGVKQNRLLRRAFKNAREARRKEGSGFGRRQNDRFWKRRPVAGCRYVGLTPQNHNVFRKK